MAPQRTYFSIKCQHTALYWDLGGQQKYSEITLQESSPRRQQNQLFYEDLSTGTIKAKLNNLCIQVESMLLAILTLQICYVHK